MHVESRTMTSTENDFLCGLPFSFCRVICVNKHHDQRSNRQPISAISRFCCLIICVHFNLYKTQRKWKIIFYSLHQCNIVFGVLLRKFFCFFFFRHFKIEGGDILRDAPVSVYCFDSEIGDIKYILTLKLYPIRIRCRRILLLLWLLLLTASSCKIAPFCTTRRFVCW